jgi:DNA invertase Pin-like site-specific DNA recombinase
MQKTVIYCRKSSESDERQVQSLDDQQTELKNFIGRFNEYARTPDEKFQVMETLTESYSAKKSGQGWFSMI